MTASNPCIPAGATVIEDTVVEARLPWSGRVDRGEHLVLVDLEGRQAIDFLSPTPVRAIRYRGGDPR